MPKCVIAGDAIKGGDGRICNPYFSGIAFLSGLLARVQAVQPRGVRVGSDWLEVADKLESIVEQYFSRLRAEHGLGAGTDERSYYPALADLLNALGQELRPKVLCLSDLANTGAGHPDFGLYAANQIQKGEPRKGQPPERGVIEMKGVGDETWLTANTKQVSKYFGAYRLVIVFRLAPNAKAFWELVATPRNSAERVGAAFGEYLKRALTQSVALREPKDVAWFLASYARRCGRVKYRARPRNSNGGWQYGT
jgi:hypothetical protein